MAFITAETRSSIVELAMGMLNQAPSSELLTTLIGKSTEGASLQDLADYIATTDAFTAEYPATQTAREFATEMFGKLITGGTLDADINTAVIDLLEGLLIAGTTKAEGFVAVINFLADSANADHPDLGDIAQAFQNRADAAEYFSVTKELGDSSDADLAAAIALVTSDAATLTAANAAADATASAAAPVASQTLTLTTAVETISGTIADETINAPATSGTTGAAATTLSSGDVIDGGAGTDTLNITMTATNNNSLAGVTVKNVEKVYVTGANFQTSGATGAALATATAAKAATAASLAAAQAAGVAAQQQDNAANAVTVLATSAAANGAGAGKEGEDNALALSTATVASAASNAAAAVAIDALTTEAEVVAASTATALPTGATAFSLAQYNAAALAALKAADGTTLITAADDSVNITARAALLAESAENVKVAVDSTQQDLATAIQLKAAADAVDALTTEAAVVAASTGALPTGVTTFTKAQYNAVALASLSADTGATLITAGDDSATITARAAVLAAEAAELVTYETNRGDFTLAQLNSAAAAALTSATGSTLQTNGDDSAAIATRATALDAITATGITAAATETAKAVVADNTAASALAVATAAAAAVGDASLSGASFAGSTEVWMVGANSNKTDLTVTTQAAGLSGVTGLDNKITFGTTGTLAVAGSTGTVDIGGAAGGLTIGGTGGTLTLTNTGGTTEAKAVKALTISTSGAMATDVAGLAQLTTVTSNGAGGATVSGSGAKLSTIATGDGADSVKIGTTTVKDNTTTAADETVNADVSTGAGNDTVNIGTTGAGNTTVATGAGNDNVYVQAISSGVGTITTGEGNDTVNLNVALAANPNMTIAAGDGVDSLITAGGTLTAVDYLRMNTALSGFETVTFTGDTVLDASELSIGSIAALTFTNAGKSTVTKVGATALVTAPLLAVTASTNGITPSRGLESGTLYLDATAAGYTAGVNNTSAPVYAGALNITYAAFGGTTVASGVGTATVTGRVEADAASATITVVSTGGATAAASNAAKVTLGANAGLALGDSDLNSLVVNLSSARGTAAATAATEYLAEFDAGTIVNTAAGTYDEHLEALSSLKVNGTGTFTIDTGSVSKLLAKLTTIDVSGMVAMANLGATGVQENTTNRSTSSITLNDNVSETVILGGARDTVATDSTVAAMDTITGFQLTASAASALVADTTRSDVLDLTTGTAFTKFISTSASTFAGMLTEAGAAATAGGVATDNLVFHFGGDTYVYVDTGANGLTDNDVLVKLTGTLDLDQMITAGVIA